MAPLSWCANIVDAVFHRLAGKVRARPTEDSFEEEIRTIVSEGHREGLLEEDAREMIEGVIELRDADVAEIMTPRTDMHTMHVGLSWDEMLKEIIRLGHTRIPVYDKNRDDIIGILHSKDLLPLLANGSEQPRPPLRELLRKPYFVPESKPVADLLQVFQQTRNHIAVVLDEYGGVSGLVTIEDVLEEIVGEIVDEYDEDIVEEIHKIDEHTCEALGRAHVDEINEEMGFSLPEDGEYDTIAGFVFTELGHVPLPGESIVWSDQMRITVLEATRRRIDRVRLELVGESTREIA
jgi:CBS domain containing-hemolysin-like protein